MTSPKAVRILKRTAVGGTLALALATILWLTNRSSDGRPVLITAAIVLVAVCFETSRMGTLRGRDLLPVMLASAAGVLILALDALETRALIPFYDGLPLTFVQHDGAYLRLAYAWTAAIAAATFGLAVALRSWPRLGHTLPRALTYAVLGATLLFVARDPTARVSVGFVVMGVLVVCTLPLVLRQPRGFENLAVAVVLCLWIIPPLPALWAFWHAWGTTSLVALLILSKIGDTFGYYVGNAFGKSHPFPSISPGKTTAGCVGSFLGATATGGALAALGLMHDSYTQPVFNGMLAGAIINVAAQAGDLLESWVKRRTGVKDSSTVFGPSGGVLDQIDSLLLTVPVGSLIWALPVGAG